MRPAIAEAEVGDEQRGENPTVNRLQEWAAELLGKPRTLCSCPRVPCATRSPRAAPAPASIAQTSKTGKRRS